MDNPADLNQNTGSSSPPQLTSVPEPPAEEPSKPPVLKRTPYKAKSPFLIGGAILVFLLFAVTVSAYFVQKGGFGLQKKAQVTPVGCEHDPGYCSNFNFSQCKGGTGNNACDCEGSGCQDHHPEIPNTGLIVQDDRCCHTECAGGECSTYFNKEGRSPPNGCDCEGATNKCRLNSSDCALVCCCGNPDTCYGCQSAEPGMCGAFGTRVAPASCCGPTPTALPTAIPTTGVESLISCSDLKIEKNGQVSSTAVIGEMVSVSAVLSPGNYGIIYVKKSGRAGGIENTGFEELCSKTAADGVSISCPFTPAEAGSYEFAANSFESDSCRLLCSSTDTIRRNKLPVSHNNCHGFGVPAESCDNDHWFCEDSCTNDCEGRLTVVAPSPTPTSTPTPSTPSAVCRYITIAKCVNNTCTPLTQEGLNQLRYNDLLRLTVYFSESVRNVRFGIRKSGGAITEIDAVSLGTVSPLASSSWSYDYRINSFGSYEFQGRVQRLDGIWDPADWFGSL